MLANQLKLTWKVSLSIAWSLVWRQMVIGIIPAVLLQHFAKSAGVFSGLVLLIMNIVLGWVVLAFTIWWLFEKDGRVGSLRVFLMQQAHYQELTSNPALQMDASPQSGSRP